MNLPPVKPNSDCDHLSENRPFLHNARVRGLQRRVCTTCLLRLNPRSFCPSCFQVHDEVVLSRLNPSEHITCVKCSSISHSHCVPRPSSTYFCPPCADPKFIFFDAKKPIDEKSARVFLCVATIAAKSMRNAVVAAEAAAQGRVRVAAAARKAAKEAIDKVRFLENTKKAKDEKLANLVNLVKNVEIPDDMDVDSDSGKDGSDSSQDDDDDDDDFDFVKTIEESLEQNGEDDLLHSPKTECIKNEVKEE